MVLSAIHSWNIRISITMSSYKVHTTYTTIYFMSRWRFISVTIYVLFRNHYLATLGALFNMVSSLSICLPRAFNMLVGRAAAGMEGDLNLTLAFIQSYCICRGNILTLCICSKHIASINSIFDVRGVGLVSLKLTIAGESPPPSDFSNG